jgi:transposase-like protein
MQVETFEQLKQKALQQFKEGKSIFRKGGAFAPLVRSVVEAALEAEMDVHLNQSERALGNKRNGKKNKTIKSSDGAFLIETPQDRHSTFAPQIVKKRQTIIADSMQETIIKLYGAGTSLRDISKHIEDIYGTEISHTLLSQITDRVIPEIQAWQKRPLDPVYSMVFLDAMHCKVQENGEVRHKALYNVLATKVDGRREILGMYLAESEGAKLWLQILKDLQNRGVKDLLIVCIDNLKGFSEAIETIFPKAEIQVCIVHQIRNSLRYITFKDKRAFLTDLKEVYKAPNKAAAQDALLHLSQHWGAKYPLVIKSWEANWERLSAYFSYPADIRRMMYTTNAVEGFHRGIRKVTKTKGAFTSDMALLKLAYLAMRNISSKWETPIPNWALIAQQLAIIFGERMPLKLKLHA